MSNPFEINSGDISRGRVKRGKNLGFDEAFLDLQNAESEVLEDERDSLNYRILWTISAVCLLILAAQIFALQAIQGQHYRALAEGNKLRVQLVLAPRGLLLDRFGKIIASNTPSFELDAVTADLPKDLAELETALAKVSAVVGKDEQELRGNLAKLTPNSYQDQTLVENITKDQALILIARQNEFPGFTVSDIAIRDYKDPLVFTHLTGYAGKITAAEFDQHPDQNYALNDYFGKTGIENEYEQYLHGRPGKKQVEIDAQGNFKGTQAQIPAQPGHNVTLNIDYDLQTALYQSLVNVMGPINAKKAAAVVTNPQTGEVLAFVSLPSFDSNMFARGISQADYSKLTSDSNNPFLDRVITGTYPPGSTIKSMLAVAGLTEGVITTQTKILDNGVIRVGNYTFYGYEHGGLGLMDVYSAIAKSSDIYFYSVGGGNPASPVKEGLGPDKIAKYLRQFHLGQTLGIDLPSEKPGLVPDPAWKKAVKNEPWYLGDTYHESIGQGDVLATPLQVNSWTSTVANGGKVLQPYILNQVTDKEGKVLAKGESKVLAKDIFDPAYIKVAQDGMRQAVTDGSARALVNLGVAVSGKTGTAQFDARDLARTHSWFTSYAPSDNPQIAMTIIVEGAGEGHSVAVPIAKAVYQWWIENRYRK